MCPDHSHAWVAGQQVVPGLEVHDLLEVGLGAVVGGEEAPVVRPQHVLPPAVLGLGQGELLLGHKTPCRHSDTIYIGYWVSSYI